MAKRNQPLNIRTAIVNEDGTPNQYFLRWMQDQGVDIDAKLDPDSLNTYIQAWAATRSINAGTGLSGGGDLSADRTLNLNAGIDLLTDVDTTTTPPTDGQALVWKAADSLWKPGSVASGGGGGSGALTFISQQTLGAAAASVTFSTIPQTYEDLILVVDAGSVLNNGTTTAVLGLQFNGDTGNNYMFTMLGTYGAGTGFSNNSAATNSMGVGLDNSSGTAGVPFSFNHIEIANYTSATRKSAIGQFSGYQGNVGILQGTASGNWTGTAAITSLTIVDRNGNNFAAGSKFTLYARVKSGNSGNDPTLYLIHDQILTADAATYDVTNIPQNYEDLYICVEARQNAGAVIQWNIRPNNDSGANYTSYMENRFGTGTTTTEMRFGCSEAAAATAGVYAPNEGFIYGYSKTSRFKDFQSHGFYPSASFEDRNSGVWRSNTAITSLRFFPGSNSFVAGTRIRVYGRKPSLTPQTISGNQAVNLSAMRPLGDFTQINAGGANSFTDYSNKSVVISTNTLTTTVNLVGLRRAAPASTPYRVAVFVQPNFNPIQYEVVQYGFSDGTKYETIALGAAIHEYDTWTTSTTRVGAVGTAGGSAIILGTGFWLGLRDDGTNVFWEISSDGVNFATVRRSTRAAGYLGSAGYTNLFVGYMPYLSGGTNYEMSMAVRTWDESGLSRTYA